MGLHDLSLAHYSNEPFRGPLWLVDQSMRGRNILFKPSGLWVSVDGEHDWPDWCLGNNFRLDHLKYRSDVKLVDKANVLLLDTPEAIIAFDKAHRIEFAPYLKLNLTGIDWAKVATMYDGIIIAPYSWGIRLDYMWYYSWDCASGCIWHPRAVKSITVKEP